MSSNLSTRIQESISKAPGAVAMPFFRWGRRADPADPAGPPAPPAPAAAASAGALSSEPTFEESILSAGFDHPTFFDASHWSATLETYLQYPSVMFVTPRACAFFWQELSQIIRQLTPQQQSVVAGLLGTAIGDSVGLPFESQRCNQRFRVTLW